MNLKPDEYMSRVVSHLVTRGCAVFNKKANLQQPRRGGRSHGFWETFLTQAGLSAV